METNAQPTYIPHDAGEPVRPRESGGGIGDLVLMLAILAFAASAALAVGVFLYLQYLSGVAASDLAKLIEAEKKFQPALVEELQRLDRRMNAAEAILGTHLAPSSFFTILNTVTAKTISYSSFELKVADGIELEMDGVGRSVNSIAFQADLLGKDSAYQNPIFSNLDRQKDGVHFHLSASIDPMAINFERLVGTGEVALPSAEAATEAAPIQTSSTPAATSTPTL